MAADLYHRIFVFSAQQAKALKTIHETNGNRFHLGTVIINGAERKYTSIVRDMSEVQYSDARKLIEGDIRHIKHTSPSK